MAKLFIAGGAGFIGAHTSRTFCDMGEEVFVFDCFRNSDFPTSVTSVENVTYRLEHLLQDTTIIHGNLELNTGLQRHLRQAMPDYIIQLAGIPNAEATFRDTEGAFQAIVGTTVNLLEAARNILGLRKLVYVSSSMVYGDFKKLPTPECAEKDPKEVYGGMKLAAENLVTVFCRQFGIPYAIVRPSAVYGPTNNNRSVLKIFVENAVRAERIVVSNPDTTFLDFTHVKDLANGIALVTLSQAVNVELSLTRGEGRSLGEAVGILRRFFPDLNVKVKTESRDFRPIRGSLDISRARQLVGYNPRFSLEEGLAEYIAFVREFNPSLVPRSFRTRRTRETARRTNS